jgi:hypothetical protein
MWEHASHNHVIDGLVAQLGARLRAMAQQSDLHACKRRGVRLPPHPRRARIACPFRYGSTQLFAFVSLEALMFYAVPELLSSGRGVCHSLLLAGAVNANSSPFEQHETATRDYVLHLHELRHARDFASFEPD